MDIKFQVFRKKTLTADVSISGKTINVIVFTDNRLDTCGFYPGMDVYQAGECIKLRCFPEDRKNSDDLLKTLGLDYYDPWEIVKKTHGLMYNDYSWFKFEGESIEYDNIKIRN